MALNFLVRRRDTDHAMCMQGSLEFALMAAKVLNLTVQFIETVGNEEDGYEEVYPVLLLGNYPIWKKGGH